MRKIILSFIGVSFILIALYLGKSISENKKKARPVAVKAIKTVFIDTVNNGTVKIIIPANGSLTAKRRIELFSEVQGVFRAGLRDLSEKLKPPAEAKVKMSCPDFCIAQRRT